MATAKDERIKAIADRMEWIAKMQGTASAKLLRKWAREIHACVKHEDE
jgi:hypothetical protein